MRTAAVAYVVCFVSGIAATVWLVEGGHPWFALLVALITSGVRMRSNA